MHSLYRGTKHCLCMLLLSNTGKSNVSSFILYSSSWLFRGPGGGYGGGGRGSSMLLPMISTTVRAFSFSSTSSPVWRSSVLSHATTTTRTVTALFRPTTTRTACQATRTSSQGSSLSDATKNHKVSSLSYSTSSSSSSSSSSSQQKVEISPSNHNTTALTSFVNDISLDARLRRALQSNNHATNSTAITTPTPIQAHAIPLVLQGYDVMAAAPTGSGKTLMFVLPLLQRLLQSTFTTSASPQSSSFIAALILSPTRELAQQTATVLQQLLQEMQTAGSALSHIQVRMATGGSRDPPPSRQFNHNNPLQKEILVATPGRLLQYIDQGRIKFPKGSNNDFLYVVLDEADRMLDMGFEPQLRRIARALPRSSTTQSPPPKQTVLCSATFPPAVQRIAADYLTPDYYFVAAGRVGATRSNIVQEFLWKPSSSTQQPQSQRQHGHEQIIVTLLRQHFGKTKVNNNNKQNKYNDDNGVIVFANTKDEVEQIGKALQKHSPEFGGVAVVHGDKTQTERNRALQAFRRGHQVRVLVASDVAARGLDVPTVGLVIQAAPPRDVDTYVHRIGRTGRRGESHVGRAVTLLDDRPASLKLAASLLPVLWEQQQQQQSLPNDKNGDKARLPTWFKGMAYVNMARAMEQQEAIAAGGGTVLDDTITSTILPVSSSLDNNNASDGDEDEDDSLLYSDQDFRKTAEAGTWGSGRDTSFRSFEEEAYKSLDEKNEMDTVSSRSWTESNAFQSFDDDLSTLDDQSSVSDEVAVEEKFSNELMTTMDSYWSPDKPSRELAQAMKDICGSDKLGKSPNGKVLAALSKRGANSKLRLEYIGVFPFSAVADSLRPKNSFETENSKGLPKVLMVAEKPSIAKAIAEALAGPNGPRQRRGISNALPVYVFTSNNFVPSQESDGSKQKPARVQVIVTSVVGHLFGLAFEQDGSSNFKVDPFEYFNMPVVKQEESTTGKLRVIEHLRALAVDCEHLVLWLDNDAEGENIAHEVMGVARKALAQKAAQYRKDHPTDQPLRRIHRARFSSITGEALRDAYANLGEPDAALSRSVDARQELDLRVGVALTRLLTWKCVGLARRSFSPATRLISYGPCQTPALSLCVDRAREIDAFEPKDYWKAEINAAVSQGSRRTVTLKWRVPAEDAVEGRARTSRAMGGFKHSATFNKKAAQEVVRLASAPGAVARVIDVKRTTETIKPPLGLNTVALLSAGSKAMGMSPKQVMSFAEKLYGAGLISYPRTETTRYDPMGFDVRSMLREHTSHPEWGKTAAHLLRTKYAKSGRPPLRGQDAGDHPPITVLKAAIRDEVGGGGAWRVYEFISRNFLGSLADDLTFIRETGELELNSPFGSGKNFRFAIEQTSVKDLGFGGACPWVLRDIGATKPGESLPLEGIKLPIYEARLEKLATRPPPFLQEHELIELMDSNRIGTDASMATHVNNIVERNYVVLCDETGEPLRPPRPPIPGRPRPPRQIGRYLVPTPLGMGLIDLFGYLNEDDQISSDLTDGRSTALLARPSIRAQMEQEVKQIALGESDQTQVLEKNLRWFHERYVDFNEALSSRIGKFASSLQPTRDAIRHWRRLGVFETPTSHQATPKKPSHGEKTKHKMKGTIKRPNGAKTKGRRSGPVRKGSPKRNPV